MPQSLADDPVKLAVVTGSVREGRFGAIVADWFVRQAVQHAAVKVDAIDLADTELPVVQQKLPVAHGSYVSASVRSFAARIEAADGFVMVTPEYNHGYPASLKLALDSVYREWQAKPVGFVSYGGHAGALRAVEQLRLVVAELHMVSVRDTVSFHMAPARFDAQGEPLAAAETAAAAAGLIEQVVWWARALRDAKARQPYLKPLNGGS